MLAHCILAMVFLLGVPPRERERERERERAMYLRVKAALAFEGMSLVMSCIGFKWPNSKIASKSSRVRP